MRGAGLWKSSRSTRRQSQLVEQDAIVPVVTSDDRSIVFLSSRTGLQSPWIVSIDGGEPAQIDDTTAEIDSVDVSSSGRLVFLAAYNDKSALVVCDLPRCTNRGESPCRQIFAVTGCDGPPTAARYRPTFYGRAGMNIWSLPLDGKPPHEVTHFADTPGSTISGFAWSRDGRRLAILRSTVRNDVALLRLRPQSAPSRSPTRRTLDFQRKKRRLFLPDAEAPLPVWALRTLGKRDRRSLSQEGWQRGTNENTNRLLRQYFPQGTDLSRYSQSDLDKIALRLNQRPRETLGFQTPADTLQASVALTH